MPGTKSIVLPGNKAKGPGGLQEIKRSHTLLGPDPRFRIKGF